jgi:hypothetical protein
MGFFSPWFLVGLVGIGLPVYVHLLRRHTTPPQPFSSLMFFERGIQSSTRHRRLRYLLLFSLRTALLLLLVFAFANPFIRRAAAGASGKLLLVVVDDSFSMRAGSRLADAKQAALQVLASRPRSQRAEVMALGGRLAVLTQPIQDAAALRSAVESIQPGDSRANLGELAHGVRALVESVHLPVELHLFSDMQKTGMPANFADMELPPNVSVVLHPAGKVVPNWTVESINAPAQLADPKDPKKSRVQAVIAGYGTPAASRTVSLVVNGNTIATRKVEIPADGRATVEFQPLDVPYGLNRCAIKIDSADGFPADDISVFAVKRADPERVLFVHQASDSRSPVYFGAALAAASQASFTLQSIDSEKSTDIDPSKYAFVVLSDAMALPSIFENALLQYVRGGGSVLIAAGTSAAHRARIPIFGGYSSGAHSYSRDGYAVVGETDLTHPVMNDTTGKGVAGSDPATNPGVAKEAAGWSDLKFYYVAGVDATQSRVIARLTDQTPLLIEKQIGEGHVLLLASGFDDLTNDFPIRPAFVPFIDRTARYLSGSDRIGSRLVDSFVPLRTAPAQAGNPAAGVEIIGPDGHRALSLTEAASAQSFQLARAGFYQIRFANGKSALIGVNPDRRESDLAPIPDDLLQLWGKNPATAEPASQRSAASDSSRAKNSHSIWWYVMLLVLVAAVAESIVASRYLGTQREEA